MTAHAITFRLDGQLTTLTAATETTLATALDLPVGCGEGVCGACTIELDGEPVRSCLVLAVQVQGSDVATVRSLPRIEGADVDHEGLTPLQRHLRARQAFQCGWCLPGLLIGAASFLAGRLAVSRDEALELLAGHLCRCLASASVAEAIEALLRERREALS